MIHKHHIIPKHMGGTDDPGNLMEVSVEEHAELHFHLYTKYGKWQDWIAFHCLSGQIDNEEATLEAIKHSSRETCIKRNAENNPMWNQESKDKMVKSRLEWIKNNPEKEVERKAKIRDANTGKVKSQEQRNNSSRAAKERWKDADKRAKHSEAIKKSWIKRRAK